MPGRTSPPIQVPIYAINEAFRAHKSSSSPVITPTVSTTSTPEVIPKSLEKHYEHPAGYTAHGKSGKVNSKPQTEELDVIETIHAQVGCDNASTQKVGGNGAVRRLEWSPPLKWANVAVGKNLLQRVLL